jgi:hypothetical protein
MRTFVTRLIAYLGPAGRYLGFPPYLHSRGTER